MIQSSDRTVRALSLFAYFFLGAFALICQVVLLRELFVVVFGNEISFGMALTSWLAGVFLGAMTGGFFADKIRRISLAFAVSILLMCLIYPLSITLMRLLHHLSRTPVGSYVNFSAAFLYAAVFIIPFSFFIGFVFPLAAKIQTPEGGGDVSKIASVYIAEGFGALVSGVLYSFYLVERFPSFLIIAIASFPLLLCGALILFKSKSRVALWVFCIVLVFNAFALTPMGAEKFDRFLIQKRWQGFSNLELIESRDSKYQNIALSESFGQYNIYTNGRVSTVFPNDQDNMILAAHLLCQHPQPGKILIIGEALSGLAKHLLRYDVEEVVSVEIDPVYLETIASHLSGPDRKATEDRRFSGLISDGRRYVKRYLRKSRKMSAEAGYDIVYVSLPDPSTALLNRFYTLEFFKDIAQILKTEGVLALKVTSSENYGEGIVGSYTVSIYQTLKEAFPYVVIAPGMKNFFFASREKQSISDSPAVLKQRYKETGVRPQKLGLIFTSLYPEEKTRFIKEALEGHPTRIINADERPLAYFHFNKILGWYSGSNIAEFMSIFERLKLRHIIEGALIIILIRVFYATLWRRRRKSILRGHIMFAVAAGGFAGLSFELIILFSFQNILGYVYKTVGFIIALFMFGLPIGAILSNLYISKRSPAAVERILLPILLIEILIALACFTFEPALSVVSGNVYLSEFFIFAATVLMGILVGGLFPLGAKGYILSAQKAGKTAGVIDACDHLGAAFGAFLTGSVFLPLLGITSSCAIIAVLALTGGALILTSLLKK